MKTIEKLELQETLPSSKGDIIKGSIYEWVEENNRYEFKNNEGIVVSTMNKPAVEMMPNLFKKL